MSKSKLTRVKIAVSGDRCVGKTAFVVRYLTRRFIGEYDSDKEVKYSHKTFIDKDELCIEILDTTANQNEETLLENLKWADAYILMYSITDKSSLSYIEKLHLKITKLQSSKPESDYCANHETLAIPIIIIANKTDLAFARTVTETEGCNLSTRLECPVFELSVAENGTGVFEVIGDTIRIVKREYARECSEKSMLNTMKRALKKKIYRSKSDTV